MPNTSPRLITARLLLKMTPKLKADLEEEAERSGYSVSLLIRTFCVDGLELRWEIRRREEKRKTKGGK